MPRRNSTTTAAARTEALKNQYLGLIEPPKHLRLRAGDLPFWNAVMRSRARELWTDSDLLYAGTLARALADIELIQGAAVDETEPRHDSEKLQILLKRAIELGRLLQLTPRSKSTNARRDADRAMDAEQGAAAAVAGSDDDLIPAMRLQ